MPSSPEYFKAKAWALLHDPPNKMWVVLGKSRCFEKDYIKDVSEHEKEAASFWYELGLADPFGDIDIKEEVVKYADRLSSSMDRWLLERLGAGGVKLNYYRLHNIFNPTLSVELERIDCDKVKEYVNNVKRLLDVANGISNNEERARAKYHLLYSLYDLMWIKAGLPPSLAETRMPTHTVFDHDYATATTVNMLWRNEKEHNEKEIGGYLIEVDIPGIQRIVNAARKAGDFWAGSWLVSMLAWLTVWPLVWEYGPDIVIRPTLRLNPIYHVTLLRHLGQKLNVNVDSISREVREFYANVMFGAKVEVDENSILSNPVIPGTITLILPQERTKRDDELEKTIRGYFEKAYKCLVEWALTGPTQGGQTPSDCDDVKTLLGTPQDSGNSYLKLAREVYRRLGSSGVFNGLIQVRVTVVNLKDVYNCVLNSLTGSTSGCNVHGLENKVLSRYLNALSTVRNRVSNEELASYLTFTAGLEALHGRARVLGRSRLVIGKAWFEYDGSAVTKPMADKVSPYHEFVFHGGKHDVGFINCSICGEEPAIIHLRRDADNPNQYDRDTQVMLTNLGLSDKDIADLSTVYVRPGEALGPLCFLKRAVYYRFKQLYGRGISMFDSTEDTSFAWFMKIKNSIKLGEDCKAVEEYLSGETKSIAKLCGGSTECTTERAREIFNRCIDTTEGLNEVLNKAINELARDLGINVEGLRLSPDRALAHFRSYYAIIRGDADNVGKLNRGEVPIENYVQFLNKLGSAYNELRGAYEGVTKVIQSLGGVLVTPTYLASLSIALMITSLRDTATANYAVPTNPVTGLIFSGGDDVLALAPVELAVKIVRDLRRNYWGDENGFHRVSKYYVATPKVSGFGRSFSMRYANIMDNMNEEILATYELLEHVSKNATWTAGDTTINKDTLVISESRTSVRAAIPLSTPHEVSRALDLLNLLFILRIGGILSGNLPEDYEGYSKAVTEIIGRNNEQLLDSLWTFLISRNMTSGTREERQNTINQLNLHIEGMKRQYDVAPQLTLKLNNEASSLINEVVNTYRILRGYP